MSAEGRRGEVHKCKPIVIGERRGFAVVTGEAPRKILKRGPVRAIECRCDCGRVVTKALSNWRKKSAHSCGCMKGELIAVQIRTHGMGASREYNTWRTMIKRCQDPRVWNFHRYGGRGIRVCERWQKFENFYADMGEKPTDLQLDRINNDGNYEPGNCKWSTAKEQANNRRPQAPRNRDERTGRWA